MNRPATDAFPPPPKLAKAASAMPDRRWWLVLIFGGWLALRLFDYFAWPLIPCGFKTITGAPCPLCGGTRAATSLAQFDFISALVFNPLATLALIAVFVGIILQGFAPGFWLRKRDSFRRVVSQRHRTVLLIGAVWLNWIYLLWIGR